MSMPRSGTMAVHVEDGHNTPVYRPGDLVHVDDGEGSAPADHLGEDVLAELADGRRLLRHLLPGRAVGRYTLAAYAAARIAGAEVRRVWPVLAVVRAGARDRR